MTGTQTKAQVDKLLGDVSNGIFPDYICEDVLTPLGVKQKTGFIGSYGTSHIRVVNDLQTGRSEAQRVESIDRQVQQTYVVSSHALEDVVTEDDYDNVEEPFEAESDTVLGVTTLIMTNKEKALSDTIMSSSIITNGVTLAGTSQLSDYGNSNPTEQFKTAHGEVLESSGKRANAAVMGWMTFNTLRYHPAILATLGFAMERAGTLSVQEVARAMNVEQLFIGDAAYETAKKGQTSSLGQIWGKGILFFVRPPAAGKRQIALGYYVRMKSRGARRVSTYPLNNPMNSKGILIDDSYSFEIVNPDAGYLITDAIA